MVSEARARDHPDDHALVERRQVIGGYRTRVLEVTGDGPAFLFLHGFSDSADTWRPILSELAALGRAGVAVDLPGHGRAGSFLARTPVIPQLVEFAEAAVRCVGGRPVVVGNSLGGLAALLLGERSDEVGGVVPIGPAGFGYIPWMWAMARTLRFRVVALALATSAVVPGWVVERALRRVIVRTVGQAIALDERFAGHYAGHNASRVARHRLFGMLRSLAVEADAPLFRHEDIRCPILLIWGGQDPITPAAAARLLVEAVPGTRHEVLPGAGHMPQLQEPRRIAELLTEFAPAR